MASDNKRFDRRRNPFSPAAQEPLGPECDARMEKEQRLKAWEASLAQQNAEMETRIYRINQRDRELTADRKELSNKENELKFREEQLIEKEHLLNKRELDMQRVYEETLCQAELVQQMERRRQALEETVVRYRLERLKLHLQYRGWLVKRPLRYTLLYLEFLLKNHQR